MGKPVIIVTGIIGSCPFVGMAWHYLNYLLGLRDLGYETYYIEYSDRQIMPYFMSRHRITPVTFARRLFSELGLGACWCVVSKEEQHFGIQREEMLRLIKRATLLLNVSGSCPMRDGLDAIPIRAYIDTDPGYSQMKALAGDISIRDRLNKHNVFFTFGENFPQKDSFMRSVVKDGRNWIPTRQPIHLHSWKESSRNKRLNKFTTVMSWRSYDYVRFRGRLYGQKNRELLRFAELPKRTGQQLEIAINMVERRMRERRALTLLYKNNWRIIDGILPTSSIANYFLYIRSSKAEFSVAKDLYVRTQSGWFSERSACYLASGRPVLMQDTGLKNILPVGNGLLTYSNINEAIDGIQRINRDYGSHCIAARKLAENHFDSRLVLRTLLNKCGLRK